MIRYSGRVSQSHSLFMSSLSCHRVASMISHCTRWSPCHIPYFLKWFSLDILYINGGGGVIWLLTSHHYSNHYHRQHDKAVTWKQFPILLYPLLEWSWKGGILVSRRLSVCQSVCGQNRVRSISSTILAGSISYLHILTSIFGRCVGCKRYCENPEFEFLANFWNL